MNFDTKKLKEEGFTEIDLNNFKKSEIKQEPGVYLLYRRGLKADRYGGTDTSGLIYIGCAPTDIQRRLVGLKNGIENCNPENHSMVKHIKIYFEDGKNLDHYYVLYKHCPDSKEVESDYLRGYYEHFKDLPILNFSR